MKIFLYLLIFYLSLSTAKSIETKIVHIIQDEIITNIDIKNQFKYLLALNNNLKELDKEKIFRISNESIIREKIKKIEILKNFKKIEISNDYLSLVLKNTYTFLNLKSLDEFEIYLKGYDLNISDVKEKFIIDALWNRLIMNKYASQVTINEKKIEKKVIANKKKSKEYRLSEIIFEITNKDEINKKYKKIVKSINEKGFKNSASIFSISDTSKIGGDLGWINESSLNNEIKEKINLLKIGEISKPIVLSNGILILKITNSKKSEIKTDFKTELKKAINYERNRQLNQYSKIYYNKIKKNLEFDD